MYRGLNIVFTQDAVSSKRTHTFPCLRLIIIHQHSQNNSMKLELYVGELRWIWFGLVHTVSFKTDFCSIRMFYEVWIAKIHKSWLQTTCGGGLKYGLNLISTYASSVRTEHQNIREAFVSLAARQHKQYRMREIFKRALSSSKPLAVRWRPSEPSHHPWLLSMSLLCRCVRLVQWKISALKFDSTNTWMGRPISPTAHISLLYYVTSTCVCCYHCNPCS